MLKPIAFLLMAMCVAGVADAAPEQGRRSVMGQKIMAAPRAVASKNHLNAMAAKNDNGTKQEAAALAVTPNEMLPADKETIERIKKEKEVCLLNNRGVGNVYVWASRNSDIGNYATMVEDVVKPENNTCFVRVEVNSNDSRIDISDVNGKYFELNSRPITCGGWVDDAVMEKKILEAKKTGRILGTIGVAVGSAGLGVGIMEGGLNKAIGGKVQGQKASNKQLEIFEANFEALKGGEAKNAKTVFCELQNACTSKWDKSPCKDLPYKDFVEDLKCN